MNNEIQYLLYSMPDADGKVQVVIKDETLWCTQKAMAQLFGVGVPAISKHLKNIFTEGELNHDTTILTSSLRTPKFFVKEFCYFLMSCHQHCLGINLLVQR